jgi:Exo-beta-D-glucosaminidase Ig-fold domain
VRRAGDGGENQLAVTLGNDGHAVAAMIVLSLRDRDSGQRILPARYSENHLWLLPGETRDVTVSWRGGRQPAVPEVAVSGYNVRA